MIIKILIFIIIKSKSIGNLFVVFAKKDKKKKHL